MVNEAQNADGKELLTLRLTRFTATRGSNVTFHSQCAKFLMSFKKKKKSRIENCSVSDLNHEFQTTQSFPTIMLFHHFSVGRLIFLCFIF